MKPDASSSTARNILRQVRRRQRLTQAQLAARAGVNQTVVARYESGQQATLPALERLVAAAGYELEWTLRIAGGASAATGGARGTVSEAPAGGLPFPGPIGRRLSANLDEVLDMLDAAGATDPRLYGDVADGCEGVESWVVIGVTVAPDASPVAVIAASGHISMMIDADVRVLPHHSVVDYGWDGPGVPLTGEVPTAETPPPTHRCA